MKTRLTHLYCHAATLLAVGLTVFQIAGSAPLRGDETRPELSPRVRPELTRLMSELAASADRTTMGGRMGYAGSSPPDVIKLCRANRFLHALPVTERYEILKEWMLPSPPAEPRTAMCFTPVDTPPEILFTDIPLPNHAQASDGDVICFSELLVAAAAECGKLDELAAAAAAAPKTPQMADTLSVLTAFQRDDQQAARKHRAAILGLWRRANETAVREQLMPWRALAVARGWLRDERTVADGEELTKLLAAYASETGKRGFVSAVHGELARSRLCHAGGAEVFWPALGLEVWQPGGYYSTSGIQAGTWPPLWAERDGVVVHHAGPETSLLYLDCPLAGEFEVTVDGYCDAGADAALQYGRLLFEPNWQRNRARMMSIGQREFIDGTSGLASPGKINHLAIRVAPGQVEYYCNGGLAYADENPTTTSPWLALLARNTRTTAWANLRIKGAPKIPAQVELIQGDIMDGWISPLYREPTPRSLKDGPTSRSASAMRRYAWYAAGGVLNGPAMVTSRQDLAIQSWLAYHRPLREGDELSYEFYYEPGKKAVYPSLGRMAFVLDPTGVQLHWITDIPHMSIAGLDPDNAVAVQDAAPPPLKSAAWNQVTLKIESDHAVLMVNGIQAYQHAVSKTDNLMFGFFRYRNKTAAEIRRIVLRGGWPRQLTTEQLASPLLRQNSHAAEEERACRAALVNDRWLQLFEATNAD